MTSVSLQYIESDLAVLWRPNRLKSDEVRDNDAGIRISLTFTDQPVR